jgi:hypothetical protein
VVGDAVDGLGAEVERGQRDVRPPGGVVEAAREEGVERVLAGVPAGPVPAVVAQGDRLGQGHIEPAGPGDGRGHLGHLECVGEAGPLMVLGEDEHLGLAGQAAERGGVEDPVPVPLEAGAPGVRFLGPGPLTPAPTARVAPGARNPSSRSSRASRSRGGRTSSVGTGATGAGASAPVDPGRRVGVGQADRSRIPRHRRGPTDVAVRFLARVGAGSCHAVCPTAVTSKCPQAPPRGIERSQIRWTCASESSRPPKSWKWS